MTMLTKNSKKSIYFSCHGLLQVAQDRKIVGKDMHAYKPSHIDHNHMDPKLNVYLGETYLPLGLLGSGMVVPLSFSAGSSGGLDGLCYSSGCLEEALELNRSIEAAS